MTRIVLNTTSAPRLSPAAEPPGPPAGVDVLLAPHMKEVELPAGRVLHDAGQPFEHVYVLRSGLVSLLVVMPDGTTVGAAVLGADDVVGAAGALGSERALRRALVQLPARAGRVAASRLAGLAAEHEALRRWLVRASERRDAQIQQTVACNALHPVQTRLCGWLLSARARARTDVLPVTQEFLGQLLGVRRTTITLMARQLRDEGVIAYRRGVITIRDPDALARRACCCAEVLREQALQLAGAAAAERPPSHAGESAAEAAARN